MGVCAKSLWEDPRAKFDGGSCFYCNRATEAECRRSWLFGDRLNMRECTKDTAIFLQNRYTKTVEGVFIAVDGPRMNIEPDAFSGTFSEQVRVHPHPVHCYPPVPVTDLVRPCPCIVAFMSYDAFGSQNWLSSFFFVRLVLSAFPSPSAELQVGDHLPLGRQRTCSTKALERGDNLQTNRGAFSFYFPV